MQRGLNYRINSFDFIADWTIVLGKISIVGLALATSELATTDLPERLHQPRHDFIFQNVSLGRKASFQDLTMVFKVAFSSLQ